MSPLPTQCVGKLGFTEKLNKLVGLINSSWLNKIAQYFLFWFYESKTV